MDRHAITDTPFRDEDACRLIAGNVEAIFLPQYGMLCASLTRNGVELLGRTDELDNYLDQGSTIGIPFLHPWANRLEGFQFVAAGRTTVLDRDSPTIHFDGKGLPMHGVPGANLTWTVTEEEVDSDGATIAAELVWSAGELLEVFPFPHRLEMTVDLDTSGITIATELSPFGDIAVPISFGFHPYLRLPGVPRSEWKLELPPMRRLALDKRMIPTGVEETFSWRGGPLADTNFDDAFNLLQPSPRFAISGGDQRLEVLFLEGYTHAQLYSPVDRDFIAIEPMTAPANALISGHGLRLVPLGSTFSAAFRIQW